MYRILINEEHSNQISAIQGTFAALNRAGISPGFHQVGRDVVTLGLAAMREQLAERLTQERAALIEGGTPKEIAEQQLASVTSDALYQFRTLTAEECQQMIKCQIEAFRAGLGLPPKGDNHE